MFFFCFFQITDVKDEIGNEFGIDLEHKIRLIREKRSEEAQAKSHKRLRSHKIQVHFKMIGKSNNKIDFCDIEFVDWQSNNYIRRTSLV